MEPFSLKEHCAGTIANLITSIPNSLLSSLPFELWLYIAGFLSPHDLYILEKRYPLLEGETDKIWKEMR
jgi:hypothetical protein